MDHLKRSTRYRSYVHNSGTAPQEGEQPRPAVRVELFYNKGIGYDVTVRPIQLLPGGMYQTLLMDGRAVRVLVDHTARFSERRLTQLALQLDAAVPQLVRIRQQSEGNAPVKAAILRVFAKNRELAPT